MRRIGVFEGLASEFDAVFGKKGDVVAVDVGADRQCSLSLRCILGVRGDFEVAATRAVHQLTLIHFRGLEIKGVKVAFFSRRAIGDRRSSKVVVKADNQDNFAVR